MATKLKIVEDHADIVAPPKPSRTSTSPRPASATPAGPPTAAQVHRTSRAHRQCRRSLRACRDCVQLRLPAEEQGGRGQLFRAWDAAVRLCATRLAAIMLDRAVNGRVERTIKDGELVMERRIPSDYLLTWLLARLDPLHSARPPPRRLRRHRRSARHPQQLARPDGDVPGRGGGGLPAGGYRLPRPAPRRNRQRHADHRRGSRVSPRQSLRFASNHRAAKPCAARRAYDERWALVWSGLDGMRKLSKRPASRSPTAIPSDVTDLLRDGGHRLRRAEPQP